MAVNIADRRGALERFLARAAGQPALKIASLNRLAGGTLNQNWRVDAEWPGGAARWVLRTAQDAGVADSLGPVREFEVMKVAHGVGVRLPTPLWNCTDPAVLGQEFFIMDFLDGLMEPRKVFGAAFSDECRKSIVEQLGEELGRLQVVTPRAGLLSFLKPPPKNVATDTIANLRAYLDSHELPHPAIEFGLNWLEHNVPAPENVVLCHGDFRTGNYVVKDGHLRAILDWDCSHWGDPHEDLGWLCQRFFRFGKVALEAGGLADREPLLRGYERTSKRCIEPKVLFYWDVMANVKWAVRSLQQAVRYTSGAADSFELALVGLGTAEMEMETLDLIGRWEGLRHA